MTRRPWKPMRPLIYRDTPPDDGSDDEREPEPEGKGHDSRIHGPRVSMDDLNKRLFRKESR